jgi:hypothetical protein
MAAGFVEAVRKLGPRHDSDQHVGAVAFEKHLVPINADRAECV